MSASHNKCTAFKYNVIWDTAQERKSQKKKKPGNTLLMNYNQRQN